MVLPYQGSARFPGLVGLSPQTARPHFPGPLGFKQVDMGKGNIATKATKSVSMPPPWNNFTAKRLGVVNWRLSKGDPIPEDVKQGGLPNCPVGAILAALAHTTVGKKYLNGMVDEYRNVAIKTTVSKEIVAAVESTTNDDPDYKPQARELLSNRYFTVSLWKGEIPDTFYIEYTDGADTTPVFMGSPNEVLWPAVIEKACAFHYGSYKELGNYKKHTVNEHWQLLMGAPPQGFDVRSSTSVDAIREAADKAGTVPTIAASRDDAPKVTKEHGFAVLGMAGSQVELYNPYATTIRVSPEEFRDNFQSILFGNPGGK
jgi:hypothetical protein